MYWLLFNLDVSRQCARQGVRRSQ